MIAKPVGTETEKSEMRYMRNGFYVLGWEREDGMIRVYTVYGGMPQTFSSAEIARHNIGLVSPTLDPLDQRKPLQVYRMTFERV